jgi:hypothetical protein
MDGEEPTLRVPGDGPAVRARAADHLLDVEEIALPAVAAGLGPVAVAVAAAIERHRVRDVGQRRRDQVPPAGVRHAAVQQKERRQRAVVAAVVDQVEAQAVDLERARPARRRVGNAHGSVRGRRAQ